MTYDVNCSCMPKYAKPIDLMQVLKANREHALCKCSCHDLTTCPNCGQPATEAQLMAAPHASGS